MPVLALQARELLGNPRSPDKVFLDESDLSAQFLDLLARSGGAQTEVVLYRLGDESLERGIVEAL